MRCGALRHWVTFQTPSGGTDAQGYVTAGWTDAFQTWAEVRDASGREYFAAASTRERRTTTFVIRARSDVTSNMRILFDGHTYEIDAVARDNMGGTLTIRAIADEGEGSA